MALSQYNDKESLLQQLNELMSERLTTEKASRLTEFCRLHYSAVSPTDLNEWRLEDLYGSTLACWHFLQNRKEGQQKVRVFNPDFEQHGWQSSHTVIEVLHEDLPFLVDSLRMALNQRGLSIHAIHNSVLNVYRENGMLCSFAPSVAGGSRQEALITVQVDRHSDPQAMMELEQALANVFQDVRLVVEDFGLMLDACDQLLHKDVLQRSPSSGSEEEVRAFVVWLKDHFTFLGYDEFELVDEGEGKVLKPILGSQLGLLKVCDESCRSELFSEQVREASQFVLVEDQLSFSKSSQRSRVHRPVYPDYISIKRYGEQGELVGESRFLGLYTSSVYIHSSRQIPIIRQKVDEVMQRSGLHPHGHDWKELLQILETYPRDDLFQMRSDELADTAMRILQIHERRQIRLFLRRDQFGQFFSCLLYAPRDVYSTEFRFRVEEALREQLDCHLVDFHTYFSDSVLARTQFILRSDGPVIEDYNVQELEQLIRELARSWEDHLRSALVESLGEERGLDCLNRYGQGFSASYRADFSHRTAVVDIQHMERLSSSLPMHLSVYRQMESDEDEWGIKLFNLGSSLPLSDLLPVFENLGLRVLDEHPYSIRTPGGAIWIHDFRLRYTGSDTLLLNLYKDDFEQAFFQVWQQQIANDEFNRLVLSAGLNWKQVNLLRAYAAYMKQIRFPLSTEAISSALIHQPLLAAALVRLFESRFDPDHASEVGAQPEQEILTALDSVASLTEDRIIRQYMALIKATLRTNAYQKDPAGGAKPYLALKIAPRQLDSIPKPRPMFEIFVYSTRFEGVHLRGGKVARGGLRWSDRLEDYRTEVLGLVKAQQVKNAVIVPVGAKGGFVAKRLHDGMERSARMDEGIACYRLFISGLLDLTDNLINGEVIAPERVVRYDEDDSYLVVAADKGTATFSDIANSIALERGFWLGDAFASGGSQGYDHKKMGITARGAWVSVAQHFREMGKNIDLDPFTVVGIGDMSGDVFGNGMLLSKQIKLVAAFNHQHIFIDPTPNPETSWQERQRLFQLERSGWNDYRSELISAGGGIYERSAKSIIISPQLQKLLKLATPTNRMTPSELISALLRAPVDLIWNGGIGTYIKASTETDADVGDKANDPLRVDAPTVRAAVVGEGGNLGMTQRARIECATQGVRLNTDFIDNAAGVDCSDHEVNIKILLSQIVSDGEMTDKQRNRLLQEMTEDVSEQVLEGNRRQVQAISLAEVKVLDGMPEYRRLISTLEAQGRLDRALEYLPTDEQLQERVIVGRGLTRPELSVLISYCKAGLKDSLSEATLSEDSYLISALRKAFPERLAKKYPEALLNHRLANEIVATQLANHMVNLMGVHFVDRLKSSTGADEAQVARAFLLSCEVLQADKLWSEVESLAGSVAAPVQYELLLELQHLMRRVTRWFIRNRRIKFDCQQEVERFSAAVAELSAKVGGLLCGDPALKSKEKLDNYIEQGVPESLASVIASARPLYGVLGIIEVAQEHQQPTERVAAIYYRLGELLDLHRFSAALNELHIGSHWQALAREAYRDDLEWQQRALLASVLNGGEGDITDVDVLLEGWHQRNLQSIERWQQLLHEMLSIDTTDYAIYAVAIRELFDLAKGAQSVQ